MQPPPSVPDPLVERVAIAHRYVSQLLDELSHDPPTPGVSEDLRNSLANEIDRGAAALARTAGDRLDQNTVKDLDRHVAVARQLAAAIETEHGSLAPARNRVEQHLVAERELAARLSRDESRTSASWADEYSQNRDQLVYGL